MLKATANHSQEEARARLAAEQRALIRALVQNADVPDGVDADNAAAAAQSLYLKRRNGVGHAWPGLMDLASDEFDALFRDFAMSTSLPADGGPLADGRAFAAYLAQCKALTDDVMLELLHVDLRFTRNSRGLVPRRWPMLRIARLPQSRRWVLGFYIPGIGAFLCEGL